jgi:preprotein translocase subunit SecG
MLLTILSAVIILASALLILVVYIQNPKGGGLSTDFGAAQQIGGVQKTNDFIDKTTWSLAGLIAVLSVVLTLQMKSPEVATPTTDETGQTEGEGGGQQGGGQQGGSQQGTNQNGNGQTQNQ